MKKWITTLGALIFCFNVFSQCSDLFISEYVEGWSNNKAIELYNPTDQVISLNDYRLIRWSNGNTIFDEQYALDLAGKIQPKGTYVLVLDKRDPAGSGQDAPVWQELQNKADTFVSGVYNVNATMYHNGNDAITLETQAGTIVDLFGKVGENPAIDGSNGAWTDMHPFTESAGGAFWTKDQTLIRKTGVKGGVTANPQYFNPTLEWDSLSVNSFDSLGSHTCDCAKSVGIKETIQQNNVVIFPTVINDFVSILSTETPNKIVISNIIGQQIIQLTAAELTLKNRIDCSSLDKGLYIISVYSDNNQVSTKRLIKE